MKILCFDVETTGLLKNPVCDAVAQPRIIEFASLSFDVDSGWQEELQTLVNPGFPISQEITKITGITNEMLADAPKFADVAESIAEQLTKAQILFAHNAFFDSSIVQFEFDRLGIELPPKIMRCTMELYNAVFGADVKLSALYEYICCKKIVGAHRAINDVHALMEIVKTDKLWQINCG